MKISEELARILLELDLEDSTATWEDDWFEGEQRVEFQLVHHKLVDTTRWSLVHERVYFDLDTGKYWHTTYRTGATECQDETPYEYAKEVELTEVKPVEVKTITYKVVK